MHSRNSRKITYGCVRKSYRNHIIILTYHIALNQSYRNSTILKRVPIIIFWLTIVLTPGCTAITVVGDVAIGTVKAAGKVTKTAVSGVYEAAKWATKSDENDKKDDTENSSE